MLRSTFFQGPQSSILQETQVQIVSTADCEKSYKQLFSTQVFDERIICAGTGGHDTCQGIQLLKISLYDQFDSFIFEN